MASNKVRLGECINGAQVTIVDDSEELEILQQCKIKHI